MYCAKKEKRSINTLFKEFNCEKCKYYLKDEYILIGRKRINIFYLDEGCIYNKKEIIYNKKEKIIFKEIYIDQTIECNDKNIFIWLDKKDTFNRIYDDLNLLLNNDYNIYIII